MSSYRTRGFVRDHNKHDTFELGSRVWRLLALINDDWRQYAWMIYPNMAGRNYVNFTPRAFNKILSGVVDTYGSTAGKQYLGKFWPESLENEPLWASKNDDNPGGVARMTARRQDTQVLTSAFN
ncbi:hypothetical protein KCU75_g24781, partial [Aureobasidium melanogenum]